MSEKKKPVISHRDFVRDLGRGTIGEDVAELFFKTEFGVIAENVGERNPDFDLLITDICPDFRREKKVVPKKLLQKIFKDVFGYSNKSNLSVEVKYDEAAARHKNLFIELFFNVETGSPGTTFKCKADLLVWVIPPAAPPKATAPDPKRFTIYLFKRPEFLAWFFDYIFTNRSKFSYKTPGISPYARGIAVPISAAVESAACLGEFRYAI